MPGHLQQISVSM